jgi:hypothetical protein
MNEFGFNETPHVTATKCHDKINAWCSPANDIVESLSDLNEDCSKCKDALRSPQVSFIRAYEIDDCRACFADFELNTKPIIPSDDYCSQTPTLLDKVDDKDYYAGEDD